MSEAQVHICLLVCGTLGECYYIIECGVVLSLRYVCKFGITLIP